jgi:hypothetical protein
MKILELIDYLKAALQEDGDIQVAMDTGNVDRVFHISQVLIEHHEDKVQKRLLLCHDNYVFDKPNLMVVK